MQVNERFLCNCAIKCVWMCVGGWVEKGDLTKSGEIQVKGGKFK